MSERGINVDEYCLEELIKEVISRIDNTNGLEFVRTETLKVLLSKINGELPNVITMWLHDRTI